MLATDTIATGVPAALVGRLNTTPGAGGQEGQSAVWAGHLKETSRLLNSDSVGKIIDSRSASGKQIDTVPTKKVLLEFADDRQAFFAQFSKVYSARVAAGIVAVLNEVSGPESAFTIAEQHSHASVFFIKTGALSRPFRSLN